MAEETDPAGLMGQILGGLAQVRAGMAEATQPARCHYIRVPWGEVNQRAADGYQLCPIPPHALPAGESHPHIVWYVMARPLGPADEAAAMLEGRTGALEPRQVIRRPMGED